MSIFIAGLDLGKSQDYSALVITEASGTEVYIGEDGRLLETRGAQPMYGEHRELFEVPPLTLAAVRHIERFPLGTKYQRIATLVEDRLRRTPQPRYLAADGTGVGDAVIEMLAPLNPAEIIITGGAEVQYGPRPQQFRVPKRDLVGCLTVPLQNKALKIAKGLPHAELLTGELLAFRMTMSDAGRDTYESARERDHDDLVLAVTISLWYAGLLFRGNEQHARDMVAQQKMSELYERTRVRIGPY